VQLGLKRLHRHGQCCARHTYGYLPSHRPLPRHVGPGSLSVPGEDRRLSWPGWLTAYCRVPTPPESQGIVFAKVPGPGKLWKMSLSWKSKCMVVESPGICWATMRKYARPRTSILCSTSTKVFERFLCYFFATRDSDEHILQCGCSYMWLVTAVCVHI